jgi:hypothetical protein
VGYLQEQGESVITGVKVRRSKKFPGVKAHWQKVVVTGKYTGKNGVRKVNFTME